MAYFLKKTKNKSQRGLLLVSLKDLQETGRQFCIRSGLMKKVVTCSQMKLLDHGTIHNIHVPSLVLMERAALATAEEIRIYL